MQLCQEEVLRQEVSITRGDIKLGTTESVALLTTRSGGKPQLPLLAQYGVVAAGLSRTNEMHRCTLRLTLRHIAMGKCPPPVLEKEA